MKRTFKWIGISLLSLVVLLLLLVVSLYIPAVQNFVVSKALGYVNSSGDMQISLDSFRLRFPLSVEVGGLEIEAKGDTMLMASSARLNVSVAPLLLGEVRANDVALREIFYKQGTPDSILYLRANVDSVDLNHASVKLALSDVDIDDLAVRGGKIRMAMKNDTTPPTPPSDVPWKIHAKKLSVSNIDYRMSMEGQIEDIAATLGDITARNGDINLSRNDIHIADIEVRNLDGRILTSPVPVGAVEAPADTFPSKPMRLRLDHVALENGAALYAMKGAEPRPGLDLDYISVNRVAFEVDSLAMDGMDIRVPIKRFHASERSGLSLDASGVFAMDSTKIQLSDFVVDMLASSLKVDAVYGLLADDPSRQPVDVSLAAEIAPADLQIAFPDFKDIVAMLPKNRNLELGADIRGTMSDLHIRSVNAAMRGYWNLLVDGNVANVNDMDNISGDLNLSGQMSDLNFLKPTLMDAKLGKTVNLPPLRLDGHADMRRGVIDGNLKAVTKQGRIALDAYWNNRTTGYDIAAAADNFPVNSFMPGLGVGSVTAKVAAKGRGLDFFSPKTELEAKVDAINVIYNGNSIHNLELDGKLRGGIADVTLISKNAVLDMTVNASGNLSGETYDWKLAADARRVDLHALGVMDTISSVTARIEGSMSMTPKKHLISADVNIPDFDYYMGHDRINGSDLLMAFAATDSTTYASVDNHDLHLKLQSDMSLDTIMARVTASTEILAQQLETKRADVTSLQKALPRFSLTAEAGRDNTLWNYLRANDISFTSARMSMSNDSLINITAHVDTLIAGATRLDDIDFTAYQNGQYLRYRALVENKPGTFDEFANVQANGYIADDKLSLFLRQQNIKGESGYQVGTIVAMTDSTFSFKIVPFKPVIGYKQWTVNNDNYLIYNFRHPGIDADVTMSSNESSLRLYTRKDSVASVHGERIYLNVDNVNIADWLSLSPYAPPMKGILSADINVGIDGSEINGRGEVTLADFTYDKRRVGTLNLDVDLTTGRSGAVHAVTGLKIDGSRVMEATGFLNDSTAPSPLLLDFKLIHFPLKTANAFLAKSAVLNGYLDGQMDVAGTLSSPKFNGYINFDSASVKVAMIGTTFSFTEDKIPVDSNVVRFNGYKIFGANDNPLTVNGEVSMHSLANVDIDMDFNARNMQVVGNDKRRGSDVYGKAFVSADAKVKGNLRFIDIDASLTVNSATNVTYVMPEATTQIAQQNVGDMVRFVNFADTAVVELPDTVAQPPTAINVNALLNIQQGAVVNVDLSADGSNKVQIDPSGTVEYSLSPMGDSRFTGRININGGFARYSLPPLISEKMFNFQEGSYVTFNGDMMNPLLNIKAVDKILANVTQEGQDSRLVNFDVGLDVTGTLEQMDVKFDLSTGDDVTVENELQSMSADQRANQAMNLLLYNTYTGPGTKGTSNLSGNPLYSFLESTVNSWMANNIKGVDISLGIDQYKRTLDGSQSTTTSYSYKVSKSFYNDRIKIVVGGNYSPDADDEENLSENLINDISFEYTLNKSGTMIVRLFRHTGFESVIEGEVTQTGVGFVYKRRARRILDIFRRRPKSASVTLPLPGVINQSPQPSTENNNENKEK